MRSPRRRRRHAPGCMRSTTVRIETAVPRLFMQGAAAHAPGRVICALSPGPVARSSATTGAAMRRRGRTAVRNRVCLPPAKLVLRRSRRIARALRRACMRCFCRESSPSSGRAQPSRREVASGNLLLAVAGDGVELRTAPVCGPVSTVLRVGEDVSSRRGRGPRAGYRSSRLLLSLRGGKAEAAGAGRTGLTSVTECGAICRASTARGPGTIRGSEPTGRSQL